jgi:transcriptional regulator with XRE-family HTH domain
VTPAPLVAAITAERERRGLTQTQVADVGGLHRSMVSLIEGGHRNPRLSTLLRYARGVGVGIEMASTAAPATPSDEETAP